MNGVDLNWQSLREFMQMPAFQDLDIDCTAVGISTLDGSAVQIQQVLYLEGELHEQPETLQSHCASLIAIWSAVQASTQIDLGKCTCVGRRLLLKEPLLGRRFAIHAVRLDAARLLFVVISSTSRWDGGDRAKNLVVDLTHKAQQLYGGLGASPCTPPARADVGFDWYLFTSREIDILKLIASGLSNKQIARELGSSPNTIRNHIYAVFRKAGVSNRTELALRVAAAV
ncbi:MAG: helix-turn-helix transcriptional regulator [Acidovorax sp.]|nr:MAG: helix-turn-helix transcriptional regulator [Acidovorax sp.]